MKLSLGEVKINGVKLAFTDNLFLKLNDFLQYYIRLYFLFDRDDTKYSDILYFLENSLSIELGVKTKVRNWNFEEVSIIDYSKPIKLINISLEFDEYDYNEFNNVNNQFNKLINKIFQ